MTSRYLRVLAAVAHVRAAPAAPSLLDRALADLARHPDSSARDIASRIGAQARDVFAVLNHAAYDGACQRWHPTGGSGGPWLWEVPPCPNEPHA